MIDGYNQDKSEIRMIRYDKEMMKRFKEARKGLSPEEVFALDWDEAHAENLQRKKHTLHCHLFPEEYDHIYDSHCDISDREKGINPMSIEYQHKVDRRRRLMGVKTCFSSDEDSSRLTSQEFVNWIVEEALKREKTRADTTK